MPLAPPKPQPWIALAPMEGVSNLAMRLWWYLTSAPDALATPFLRVTPTYPLGGLPRSFSPELLELRSFIPYRLVPQMMAADAADFIRTAPLFLPHTPFVELNAGCPSPTCVGKGAGSSLLRDGDEFHRMIRELCRGVGAGAVAVKMRTGFQHDSEFPYLIEGLCDLPVARLTIHGRTRPGKYSGEARWDLIRTASERMPAPVVASGDVVDRHSLAARLRTAPQVAGVLVGRGALRNPWIFAELRQGASVRLGFATLCYALVAHALLHELLQEQPDMLFELVKEGLLSHSCGTNEERWRQLQARLSQALYGRGHEGLLVKKGPLDAETGHWPLSRQTIGRLKMLWNYLRSSLPPVFFAPTLLRAASLEAFLGHLSLLYAEHLQLGGTELLELGHQPNLDWLYSGEKQQRAAQAPAAVDADV